MKNSMGEVIAYLIMESATDPIKPQNIKVYDKNGLFYVNFDTTLQAFNRFNRNRRNYSGGPMQQSIEAPHIIELKREKTWLGESGHPMSNETARVLTIDPSNTCHRINRTWMQGNDILMGNIDTLDDGDQGTKFTKNILQGIEPAFSLRALAQLTKRPDGSALMQSKCHVVTYDRVILPSHPEAYRDKSKPIQQITQPSGGSAVTEGARLIAVNESQLKDFIQMESVNLKLVSDVYEVAMESMEISKDFKSVILRENGRTFVVGIDTKIKHDIRNHMMKL